MARINSLLLASLLALALAAPALAKPRRGDPEDGLAPRYETRYKVVGERFVSLDGSRRHRIVSLRRLSEQAGEPMVVAVYEQGEDGAERAIGSEHAEEVLVERIVDVDRDGKQELVLRVGNGGDCVGCWWLAVYAVRGGKLVELAPEKTLNDLQDLDGDGRLEGLSLRTELTGFAELPYDRTPRVSEVWSIRRGGKYRPDDGSFARWHWRQLMQHRRTLERGTTGPPNLEHVSIACALYFEHEVLGHARDGFVIASRFLRWIRGHGDRDTQFTVDRALKALKDRSQNPPKRDPHPEE